MIIDDFDVLYPVGGPTKADPKLVIDTDGVLPEPLTLQSFQPIARRAPEVFQHASSVYCFQLSSSDLDDIRLKSLRDPAAKNRLSRLVFKRSDHDLPFQTVVSNLDTGHNEKRISGRYITSRPPFIVLTPR
jgi:hypothetical protein